VSFTELIQQGSNNNDMWSAWSIDRKVASVWCRAFVITAGVAAVTTLPNAPILSSVYWKVGRPWDKQNIWRSGLLGAARLHSCINSSLAHV
jgi:hypothetical protein